MVTAQKFHATLDPDIDAEINRFMAERARLDSDSEPIFRDGAPADPDAPADPAAAVGGPISIHAPWRRD